MLLFGEPELLRQPSFLDYLDLFFLVRSCKIFCCHNRHEGESLVVVVTLGGFFFLHSALFCPLFPQLLATRIT